MIVENVLRIYDVGLIQDGFQCELVDVQCNYPQSIPHCEYIVYIISWTMLDLRAVCFSLSEFKVGLLTHPSQVKGRVLLHSECLGAIEHKVKIPLAGEAYSCFPELCVFLFAVLM